MPTISPIEGHNAGIGSFAQRFLQASIFLFLIGIPAAIVLRTLFRFDVRGVETRRNLRGPVIFAPRHYFELDPALTFYGGGVWLRAFLRPNLLAASLAGQWWFMSAPRRLAAWLSGAIVLAKGHESAPALTRAAALLRRPRPISVAIYPTGAVGRSSDYTVMPGVARLAISCPDVPVVPIALEGVRELRLSDVLSLRRPTITIGFGEPFTAREIMHQGTATEGETIEAICDRIESEWNRHGR